LELKTYFVDILLPLPIPNFFTYRVQREFEKELEVGKRVLVPFGRNKLYTGIVWKTHLNNPGHYQVKYLHSIIDHEPIISKKTAEFWTWISAYYACTLGEVMQAALPSLLKLQSEQILVLMEPIDGEIPNELSDNEKIVYDILLQKEKLVVKELYTLLGTNIFKTIRSLYDRGLVITKEEIKETYRERQIKIIEKNPHMAEGEWELIFANLERKAPKQSDALLKIFQKGKQEKGKFLKNYSIRAGVLNELIKKGFVLESLKSQSRLPRFKIQETNNELSESQNHALIEIENNFKDAKPNLLWGVTASGKTHIYIELIKKQLKEGKQSLFLLPEIALTTQLTHRLAKYFGDQLTVTHSKYNQKERVEAWNKISNGEKKVIVGARSALFSNFYNLGLIIVDEEHETSFKQFEPSPRYHARDAAVFLAQKNKAKILLGSATPSIETLENVQKGKYNLVKLNNKFSPGKKPKIQCIDLKDEYKRKRMNGAFSQTLIEEIDACIQSGKKALLFQNRKGFVPLIECKTCGHIPQCNACDVSLVYYKKQNQMRCHYCGFKEHANQACSSCQSKDLIEIGYGTEKIEALAEDIFPNYRIGRLDQNAANTRKKYEKILDNFDQGNLDILIGTQMIGKGLDFKNVGLVAIVDADSLLHFPDFRAHERTFHLITQVAGRAGRQGFESNVFIQSFKPHHAIYQMIIGQDFDAFFQREIRERKKHLYPPFRRLIKITIRDKDFIACKNSAHKLALNLRKNNLNVLGPSAPLVGRIRNKFLQDVLIKVGLSNTSLQAIKNDLSEFIQKIKEEKEHNSSDFLVDVDPY